MRLLHLVITAGLLPLSGCSVLIAVSGKDLRPLTTREQVHAQFGEPVACGVAKGRPFEEYHTRQKYAEQCRGAGLGLGVAMTYGLGELIAFPCELYRSGRRVVVGQDLRFTYDEGGAVHEVLLDGDRLFFPSEREAKPAEDRATTSWAKGQLPR